MLYILQSVEIERMSTWYNPLGMSDMSIPDEELLTSWRNTLISENTYRDMVRIAWDISPAVAVMLPTRFVHTPLFFYSHPIV